MGQVLWHLVHTIAQSNPKHGPIIFAKWDIKDGFWRLVVSESDAWHFCYVLPHINELDPIKLVKPICLQMGWMESPPLFCMASETVHDMIQEFVEEEKEFAEHPLEALCIPEDISKVTVEDNEIEEVLCLMEVYMDDFVGLAQVLTPEQLIQFTRAVLHGIHTIFPPLGPSEAQDDEPIAIKKLKQGDGLWDTRKEILGWLFDGIARTMQLPAEKIEKNPKEFKRNVATKKSTIWRAGKNQWKIDACIDWCSSWKGSVVTAYSPACAETKSKALQGQNNLIDKCSTPSHQRLDHIAPSGNETPNTLQGFGTSTSRLCWLL